VAARKLLLDLLETHFTGEGTVHREIVHPVFAWRPAF